MFEDILPACPICKLDGEHVKSEEMKSDNSFFNCERCGQFIISGTARQMFQERTIDHRFSAWIRDRQESEAEPPEIHSNTLKELQEKGGFPEYRVSEKQLLLLRTIERKTNYPGQGIFIDKRFDYPLAWAAGEKEFVYLLRSLIERELINRIDGSNSLEDTWTYKFQITPGGWNFLEDHARPSVISDQAFVAMSFSPELKPAWEKGIRPALKRAKFNPYRVDAEPHIDRIDMKIMTEIKNSRFLVADVTQQRPGVYFEAGYALGIGLPVFWCVHHDDLKNVHFDTRQYSHIVWESEEHLSEQLYFFVSAIIGKGSAAIQ